MYERADAEGRELTDAEQAEVKHARMKDLQSKLGFHEALDLVGGGTPRALASDGSGHYPGGDPGAAFVQSEGYKRIQNPAMRGSDGPPAPSRCRT